MAYDAEHFTITEVPVPSHNPTMLDFRNFLVRVPEHLFDMCEGGELIDAKARTCGTPACIGGWGRAYLGYGITMYDVGKGLGLTPHQTLDLMLSGPAMFQPLSAAITVLDHYLATGEVDWSVAK